MVQLFDEEHLAGLASQAPQANHHTESVYWILAKTPFKQFCVNMSVQRKNS